MKKIIIKVCIILCALAMCYLVFLKPKYTYTYNCSVDYIYTDESRNYVSEISYNYNSIKKEEIEVEILLERDSIIKIENYISENDSMIKILSNDNTLVSSIILRGDENIKNIVQESGEYKMILFLEPGNGKGKITIE